jgi:hypothetical protein
MRIRVFGGATHNRRAFRGGGDNPETPSVHSSGATSLGASGCSVGSLGGGVVGCCGDRGMTHSPYLGYPLHHLVASSELPALGSSQHGAGAGSPCTVAT